MEIARSGRGEPSSRSVGRRGAPAPAARSGRSDAQPSSGRGRRRELRMCTFSWASGGGGRGVLPARTAREVPPTAVAVGVADDIADSRTCSRPMSCGLEWGGVPARSDSAAIAARAGRARRPAAARVPLLREPLSEQSSRRSREGTLCSQSCRGQACRLLPLPRANQPRLVLRIAQTYGAADDPPAATGARRRPSASVSGSEPSRGGAGRGPADHVAGGVWGDACARRGRCVRDGAALRRRPAGAAHAAP